MAFVVTNENFEEVMAAGKPVVIDFGAEWCGPCKKMAKEVFPQKMVGDFMNAKFVNLKLNAEKEGRELAARYKVNAYPTFIVLDSEGKVVTDLKGSMDGQTFIQYNYTLPMCVFACFGVVALFLAFALKKEDKRKGYGLELPNIK